MPKISAVISYQTGPIFGNARRKWLLEIGGTKTILSNTEMSELINDYTDLLKQDDAITSTLNNKASEEIKRQTKQDD